MPSWAAAVKAEQVARVEHGPLGEQRGELGPQLLNQPSGMFLVQAADRAVLRGALDGVLAQPGSPQHLAIRRPARLRCRRVPPARASGG